MPSFFYQLLTGLGLLASLAACGRAVYPLPPQAAYLPVSAPAIAAVAAVPAATILAASRPARAGRRGAGRRFRRLVAPAVLATPERQPARFDLPKLPKRRSEAVRQAGSYGPYFDSGFGWAIVLLGVFYILILGLLVYLATKLLGKLIDLIVNHARRAQAPALPPAGP